MVAVPIQSCPRQRPDDAHCLRGRCPYPGVAPLSPPTCPSAELPNSRIAELPNCRTAELPDCLTALTPTGAHVRTWTGIGHATRRSGPPRPRPGRRSEVGTRPAGGASRSSRRPAQGLEAATGSRPETRGPGGLSRPSAVPQKPSEFRRASPQTDEVPSRVPKNHNPAQKPGGDGPEAGPGVGSHNTRCNRLPRKTPFVPGSTRKSSPPAGHTATTGGRAGPRRSGPTLETSGGSPDFRWTGRRCPRPAPIVYIRLGGLESHPEMAKGWMGKERPQGLWDHLPNGRTAE